MLDFVEAPAPKDVPGLWSRLVDLVRSLKAQRPTVIPVTLAAGLNIVTHGGRNQGAPAIVIPVLVDVPAETPSTAIITIGAKDHRHVRVFATTACTAELVVYFA